MRRRSPTALVAILILAAIVAWVDAPDIPRPDWVKNLLFWRAATSRDIKIVQGLDLQGGLEVLMQANPPGGGTPPPPGGGFRGRRVTTCSFCGKSSRDVGPMVEGPSDVYILPLIHT